jgi:hypothetical protein
MEAHLVLIDTSGKQDYIFATNKRRQNIGASDLIHRIGTTFVLSAVAKEVSAYQGLAEALERSYQVMREIDGQKIYAGDPVPTAEYVSQLAGNTRSSPLGDGIAAEVIVATSGKAVLMVDKPATGKRIIEDVTLRSLREAPGAVVRGIVDNNALDLAAGRAVAQARMNVLTERLEAVAQQLPPPEARFPALPIVAPCTTSGLPAEYREGNDYFSTAAYEKRKQAEAGWRRVKAAVGPIGDKLAKNLDDEMGFAWYGVVHADGNGFGKVFRTLAEFMPRGGSDSARAYFDFYQDFSLALEMAGVAALRMTLESGGIDPISVVPLVFGGDDLTVICDGSSAVTFAETYLQEFERATALQCIDGFDSVIPTLVDPESGTTKDGFGGAAGIAIIKPHHPFHRGYDLAEALTRSAKETKVRLGTDAVSALDFQVVYQDATSDLDKLRKPWTGNGTKLHGRPYVVSVKDRMAHAKRNRGWAERHHIAGVKRAIRALRVTGDDETDAHVLPRSQQHALRNAFFAGLADQRFELIRERYDVDWRVFGEQSGSLFFADGEEERRTRFLDALELIDIGERPGADPRAAPVQEAAE